MSLISTYDLHDLHQQSRLEATKLLSRSSPSGIPFKVASNNDERPAIPPESVFASLSDSNTAGIPAVAENAVHLELLEAFMVLRRKVFNSNALDWTFGIEHKRGRDLTLSTRRQEKWKKFVELAVVRFKTWFALVHGRIGQESFTTAQRLFLFHRPPLDVLMVQHSLLLNSDDCDRLSSRSIKDENDIDVIRETEFPWRRIHESIDPNSCEYNCQLEGGSSDFVSLLQGWLHFDLLSFLTSPKSMSTSSVAFLRQEPKTLPSRYDEKRILDSPAPSGDRAERWLITAFAHPVSIDTHFEGTDLAAAVHRQSKFIDKICHFLWIRSPALVYTLKRARTRYENFFSLFGWYPNRLIVPTLDVDLVWHTHQLSPRRYREFCMDRAGRFIGHDDKLKEDTLHDSFQETKSLYRLRFHEEYLLCHCWDCEAIRATVSDTGIQDETELKDAMEKVRVQVAYHRAAEVARRRKKPLPVMG